MTGLILNGGNITIGRVEPLDGIAVAADASRVLATLVRREDETIGELLRRLDALPWDSAAADRYGTVRAAMTRHGKTLAPLDLLIAAHALSVGAVLVTNDRAFGLVAELPIEDWSVE